MTQTWHGSVNYVSVSVSKTANIKDKVNQGKCWYKWSRWHQW